MTPEKISLEDAIAHLQSICPESERLADELASLSDPEAARYLGGAGRRTRANSKPPYFVERGRRNPN